MWIANERLKELRKEHRETQADLAKALNVEQCSVSRWERDAFKIPAWAIVELCRYYDVSADWVLGLRNDR